MNNMSRSSLDEAAAAAASASGSPSPSPSASNMMMVVPPMTSTATRSASMTSLHRKTPSLSTYQTTPITKHYEINNQILAAFESHYEQKLYQVAYAIGLQFVETALLEIPKHGYYHSTRHEKERMQSSLEAARVAHILMDIQQEQRDSYPASEEKRLRQLSALAWEQIEQASIDQDAYERRRKQAEQELRNIPSESNSWVVCEPLMSMASDSFSSFAQLCPPELQKDTTTSSVPAPPPSSSSSAKRTTTTPTTTAGVAEQPPQPQLYGGRFQDKLNKEQELKRLHAESIAGGASTTPPLPPESARRAVTVASTSVAASTVSSSSRDKETIAPSLMDGATSVSSTASTATSLSNSQWRQQHQQQLQRTPPQPSWIHDNDAEVTRRSAPPPPASPRQHRQQPQYQSYHSHNNSPYGTTTTTTTTMLDPQMAAVQMAAMGRSIGPPVMDRMTSDDLILQKALYLSGLNVNGFDEERDNYNHAQQQQQQQQQHYQYGGAGANAMHHQMTSDFIPEFGASGPSDVERQMRQSMHLELATLAELYHEDFDGLQSQGRVRVSYIDTYQGRLPESTNGCTVIAPLLCMHHLLDVTLPDPGLPDAIIKQVIDVESSIILSELRKQLGLAPNAFLIPSDAHDCLIQNGQLSQEQFVTVLGGNVLDDTHLHAFVNTLINSHEEETAARAAELAQSLAASSLSSGLREPDHHEYENPVPPRPESVRSSSRSVSAPAIHNNNNLTILSGEPVPESHRSSSVRSSGSSGSLRGSGASISSTTRRRRNKKLAATFFFHEHVIAVLQVPRDDSCNTCWYDVIDSLPSKETMRKRSESEAQFCRRVGITEEELFLSEAPLPKTVRMRCLDSEALVACIRWFACSRFTDENMTYIDQYKWDDEQCDFDPRVFQAFIWKDVNS